jgi:hypothetical protein
VRLVPSVVLESVEVRRYDTTHGSRGAGLRFQRTQPLDARKDCAPATLVCSGCAHIVAAARTGKWFATSVRALDSPGMDRALILAASEESGSSNLYRAPASTDRRHKTFCE